MPTPSAVAVIVASPGGDLGAMTHLEGTATTPAYEDTFLVQDRAAGKVIKFDLATGLVTDYATYTGFDGSGQAITKPIGHGVDYAPGSEPPGYLYCYTVAPPELGGALGGDIVELKALRIKPGDIAEIDLFPRDYLTGLELLSMETQFATYRYAYRWDNPPGGPTQWLRTVGIVPEDGSTYNLSATLAGGSTVEPTDNDVAMRTQMVTAAGHVAGAGQFWSGAVIPEAPGDTPYVITALSPSENTAGLAGPQLVLWSGGAFFTRNHIDPLFPTAQDVLISNLPGATIRGVSATVDLGSPVQRYFCTIGDGNIYEIVPDVIGDVVSGWKIGTIGMGPA